jgi:ribose/xylose/arabinose/galactoside ABC-type transport system permease subunit
MSQQTVSSSEPACEIPVTESRTKAKAPIFARGVGQQGGLLIALIALGVSLTFLAPHFLSPNNLLNVLRQVSMTAIIAVGMTMVITCAEIDLSVGSLACFSGVVLAWLAIEHEIPLLLAFILTLGVGVLVGTFTGFIRTSFNIPSFIITLGLFTALRSGAYVISDGFPIAPFPASFNFLGGGFIGPIPVPVIIMFITYLLGYIALNHTSWGRSVHAVGGNEEASRLSGINTQAIKMSVFMLTSLLAAFAGMILASRLDSGTPAVAVGWEMAVIAAVIIGGTSLFGGKGNIVGTLLGVLFVAILGNGMVLMGISPYVQGVVSGSVILLAVIVSAPRDIR